MWHQRRSAPASTTAPPQPHRGDGGRTYGYIRNGRVQIDNGASLPEGTEVEITLREGHGRSQGDDVSTPTLYDQLADVIGTVPDLPEDLSVNPDHHLYGTTKRE